MGRRKASNQKNDFLSGFIIIDSNFPEPISLFDEKGHNIPLKINLRNLKLDTLIKNVMEKTKTNDQHNNLFDYEIKNIMDDLDFDDDNFDSF